MAALVPPATHTAHADDAVAQTVEVSSYDDLKNVVERIGDNDRSGHTIVVKKDIAFDQMITLSKGQHITLVSDSATCAGHVQADVFGTCHRGSQLLVVQRVRGFQHHHRHRGRGHGQARLQRGGQRRLLLVGTDAEGVNQRGRATINGGTFNNNGKIFSDKPNTTGDGYIAYVYPQGNLSVNGGTFSDNQAPAIANPVITPTGEKILRSGGAVIHSYGNVSINGGTFEGNYTQANSANNPGFHGGGAIWSDGTLTINNGTFTNNVSPTLSISCPAMMPTTPWTRTSIRPVAARSGRVAG